MTLPSIELAKRVYNGGHPFISSSLRLHLVRWTCLLNSTATSLLFPVKVDMSGIPAHAWELATVELILGDHCWITGVLPDTARHRDVVKVEAWCSNPTLIPSELDLEILEPLTEDDDSQHVKRTLVYPILISITPDGMSSRPGDPSSPPPADDGRRRRRGRRSGLPRTPPASVGAPRASVHERLGLRPVGDGHVEPRDSVATELQDSTAAETHDSIVPSSEPSLHVTPPPCCGINDLTVAAELQDCHRGNAGFCCPLLEAFLARYTSPRQRH